MNILIIEDEKYSAEKLKQLITAFDPKMVISGQCKSVASSIEWLKSNPAPNLIFMDIELTDGVSFDIFEHVEIRSQIIFTTAYDEYAIKAIKLGAMDYILKPVTQKELYPALTKANTRMAENSQPQNEGMKEIIRQLMLPSQKLAINSVDGTEFVAFDNLLYLTSDSNYTHIILTNGRKITAARTLKYFEDQLDRSNFFRVHSKHLINLKYVEKLKKENGGMVVMKDNTEIDIARDRKKDLFKLLGL